MFMVIDGPSHFLESFRGEFDRKSLLVCSKSSVLPDTVCRTALAGTREVDMISIGSQEPNVQAGWTGHTIPLICWLSGMHNINSHGH